MRTFLVFAFLFSGHAMAQKEMTTISDKMKPLTFQVEKQLGVQIKSTLEESLKIKDISVGTSLKIDPNLIAQKYNLLPRKSKFVLPGLDESASNGEENLINFNPTLQDVYFSLVALNVKVSSLVVFSETEKADIEKVIADDLSTLNLKKINYSFYKLKNLEPSPEPVVEKKMEDPSTSLAKSRPEGAQDFQTEDKSATDTSTWLFVGLAILGILLVATIFVVGYLLIQQFKNMASSLTGAISQIDLAPEKNSSQSERASVAQVDFNGRDMEGTTSRIRHLVTQMPDQKHFFRTFISNFSGIRFYVICESLGVVEREELKKQLSRAQHQEYVSFLQAMGNGDINMSKVTETSEQLAREVSLYIHDADTFVGQTAKNKIRSLDNVSLKSLIEKSNGNDFMTLAQVSDPLSMSVLLNDNPDILNRYESLEVREVRPNDLSAISQKIEALNEVPPHLSLEYELKLREFVSEDVEILLNQKTGKEKTLWEELDNEGMLSLYDFTIGLAPKEASIFVSIIPEKLREDVLIHIPELKREQIKRHGFEVSRRSMELKHQFFQSLRS